MRISDWSSDVCSSDLRIEARLLRPAVLIKSARGDRVALKLRFDGKFDSARFQYLLTAPQLAFGKTRFLDLRGEGEGRISRAGATLIPLHMRARRMIGQGAILDGIFNTLALDGVLQLQGQTLTSKIGREHVCT